MKKDQNWEEILIIGSSYQSCNVRVLPVPGFKTLMGNCAVGEALAEFKSVRLSVDAKFRASVPLLRYLQKRR